MSQLPRLYQRHARADKLQEAVDAFAAKLNYLYFESEATIDLLAYTSPGPTWTHGRAFGSALEIRWEQVDDGFDLLLLTEMDLDLPPGWQLVSDTLAGQDSQILLWGSHINHLEQSHQLAGEAGDAWIETRIPRSLNYPVSGLPRWVKARVIVYHHDSQPILTRLVSLEGEDHVPQTLW